MKRIISNAGAPLGMSGGPGDYEGKLPAATKAGTQDLLPPSVLLLLIDGAIAGRDRRQADAYQRVFEGAEGVYARHRIYRRCDDLIGGRRSAACALQNERIAALGTRFQNRIDQASATRCRYSAAGAGARQSGQGGRKAHRRIGGVV